MSFKLLGAICIIVACGGCGFIMTAHHVGKIRKLQNLIGALEYMECELQYHCTPLPQLCRQAAQLCQGHVCRIFTMLADELDAQILPDVNRCMVSVLARMDGIERPFRVIFEGFGRNLGKFDLNGQVQGIIRTRLSCEELLKKLMQNKDSRLRSYQTLGLCAGAAIAILFV